jgi:hypothetical protein
MELVLPSPDGGEPAAPATVPLHLLTVRPPPPGAGPVMLQPDKADPCP